MALDIVYIRNNTKRYETYYSTLNKTETRLDAYQRTMFISSYNLILPSPISFIFIEKRLKFLKYILHLKYSVIFLDMNLLQSRVDKLQVSFPCVNMQTKRSTWHKNNLLIMHWAISSSPISGLQSSEITGSFDIADSVTALSIIRFTICEELLTCNNNMYKYTITLCFGYLR